MLSIQPQASKPKVKQVVNVRLIITICMLLLKLLRFENTGRGSLLWFKKAVGYTKHPQDHKCDKHNHKQDIGIALEI